MYKLTKEMDLINVVMRDRGFFRGVVQPYQAMHTYLEEKAELRVDGSDLVPAVREKSEWVPLGAQHVTGVEVKPLGKPLPRSGKVSVFNQYLSFYLDEHGHGDYRLGEASDLMSVPVRKRHLVYMLELGYINKVISLIEEDEFLGIDGSNKDTYLHEAKKYRASIEEVLSKINAEQDKLRREEQEKKKAMEEKEAMLAGLISSKKNELGELEEELDKLKEEYYDNKRDEH